MHTRAAHLRDIFLWHTEYFTRLLGKPALNARSVRASSTVAMLMMLLSERVPCITRRTSHRQCCGEWNSASRRTGAEAEPDLAVMTSSASV
jgi:hypothetical protein